MRIAVNREKCQGTGLCEAQLPEIFEIRDDGSAAVRSDEVTGALRDAIEQAVSRCPTEALSIVE